VRDRIDNAIDSVVQFPTQITGRSKRRGVRICGLVLQPLILALLAIPVIMPLLGLSCVLDIIQESKHVA
jgi:hypothetical protein